MPSSNLLNTLRRALAAWLACACLLALAQDPAVLPTQLEPGPHPVGFRLMLARDYSRPPIAPPGQSVPATAGRLVPLHYWYPATAAQGARVSLGDYAEMLAHNTDARPLDDERRQRARQRFLNSVAELGGDRGVAEREFPRLWSVTALAHRDAPPASGPFPVVLFPEYYAPASNSLLAEYLASHGFVVVSVPMLAWRSELWPGGSPPNFESYIGDLQFALGAVRELPFADRSRIAAMGVGITANAVLGLQMRNALIRVHVSLDGGLISPTEDAILKRTPFFDAGAIRSPMLFIWSPHPNLRPELADQYKYAERLMLHLPGMTEYRYLNYGPLEALAPGLMDRAPGDTGAGWAAAARYVRAFLEAQLRDDPAAQRFLANDPAANGLTPGLVQPTVVAALPAPPSLDDVKAMITNQGFAAFAALYRTLRERDPEPYSQAGLLDLQIWAGGAGRDPDGTLRRDIGLLRLAAFPQSARVHFALANVALQRRELDAARHHFRETLRLLPDDRDPSLDDAFKALLRQRVEDALKRLDTPPS